MVYQHILGGVHLKRIRFKSIVWKISLPFVALVIFSIVTSTMMSQNMLSNASDYTMEQLEGQLADKEATVHTITQNKVDSTVNTAILLAEQLSYQPEVIEAFRSNNPALLHEALADSTAIAKEKAGIDLIWFTRLEDRTSDGFTPIFACPTNPAFDGFDGLNYGSTNRAIDNGETVASWEVNEEDGKLQVTTPIKDEQGRVIGAVVVGQQTYQAFVKQIADASQTAATLFLTPNQNDFYIMTDTQSDELGDAFFEQSREKQAAEAPLLSALVEQDPLYAQLQPYLTRVVEGEESFTETVDIDGQPYVMQFTPFTTYDGKTVGVYLTRFPGMATAKQDIIDQSRSTQQLYLLFAVGLIVLSAGVSYGIARMIARPIVKVTHRLEEVAEGDLTGEPLETRASDEVGRLVIATGTTIGKLRELIQQTNTTASHVASSSVALASSAEETAEASQRIATAVQEVAAGAEKQVQNSDETTRAMGEIAAGIQRIAESSFEVSESSIQASSLAGEGQASVGKVVTQMQLIHESVNDTAGLVSRLGEKSKQIDQIVRVITEISGRTNLLAINAAIEAARAGEHGKGFTVVATEVKKLADQSKQSAGQIVELIEGIQLETSQAVESMNQRTLEVKDGLSIAEQAGRSFKDILAAVERVAEQIQEVSAASEEMSASSEQVAASVEELAQIAKLAHQSTYAAAATSEDQLASTQEIAAASESLSELSKKLQANLLTFKV